MDHHIPSVYVPGKGYKNVKNLGWLLRHRDGIANATINKLTQGEAFLIVLYYDGTVYRSHFASFAVCTDWCKRYLDKYCNVEVK